MASYFTINRIAHYAIIAHLYDLIENLECPGNRNELNL